MYIVHSYDLQSTLSHLPLTWSYFPMVLLLLLSCPPLLYTNPFLPFTSLFCDPPNLAGGLCVTVELYIYILKPGGLIGGYTTRDNISFFPASVVKPENCEEKHQIHDCPIKASFIKYWPGRWNLARSIAGIPRERC